MATPVGDSYTCASGGAIAAGRHAMPAWHRAQAVNTWRTIPGNTLYDIDPCRNIAYNTNYPANAEWGDSNEGMITPWCGGCLDVANAEFWIPLGGGHEDYGGNESYKINLDADTPTWVMVHRPSGSAGDGVITRDDAANNGGTALPGYDVHYYSDGRPRGVHTYNRPLYVPGVGPFMAFHGSTVWHANNGSSGRVLSMNPTTGDWTTLPGDCVPLKGNEFGGCVYDPTRNSIWAFPSSSSAAMQKYNLTTQAWSEVGATITAGASASCYLPDDDCILVVGCSGFANGFAVFDCAAATWHYPAISGTFTGGIDFFRVALYGGTTPAWVPWRNGVAMWDNNSATTQINFMSRPANPRTGTWVISQLPVGGTNTVTPTGRTYWGTYGRFQCVEKLHGFMLLNAANQQIYFYKDA